MNLRSARDFIPAKNLTFETVAAVKWSKSGLRNENYSLS